MDAVTKKGTVATTQPYQGKQEANIMDMAKEARNRIDTSAVSLPKRRDASRSSCRTMADLS